MAESDASLDAQLDLKKRARRRLVGAAALALLAAIVLPMVMDREPRPPVQDIQVRIPSQDAGGFTSRILPAKPAATPLPPVEPVVEAKTETKPAAKADSHSQDSQPSPAPAKEPPAAVPAGKPVDKAPEKASEPAAGKPVDKAPAKAAEAAAAAKADEARAAAALSGTAAEQWVVQLGAYKEAGNVKLLLAKIKQLGLPAYTESFDSPQGPRTRVRAGPFPSKEAAEKAQVRIKIIGVQGPVAPK